jgi:hypothetical protein
LSQQVAQKVGKEVVVPIPAMLVVQRNDEQVAALQVSQRGHPVALTGEGIAQRATQAIQDGSSHQEAPHRLGLASHHLFGQILRHIMVAAVKGGDELAGVGAALQ